MRHSRFIVPSLLVLAATVTAADSWNLPTSSAGTNFMVGGNTVTVSNGGYGSAIARVPGTSNQFWVLGDRGPNIDGVDGSANPIKVFPLPNYAPRLMKVQINDDGSCSQVGAVIELKRADGTTKLTGLPIPSGATGATLETAYGMNGDGSPNLAGGALTDSEGLDSEGLVALSDGTFWISDEYGPFLLHVDATGKTLERIDAAANNSAGHKLPKVLLNRVPNKGMEGLTLSYDGKLLVGLMQAAVTTTGSGITTDEKVNLATRIVTYDLATGSTKQYVYLLDDDGTGVNNSPTFTKAKALGANSDIVAVGATTYLVIERDGKFPANGATSKVKKVYQIDLANATDISDSTNDINGKKFNGLTVEAIAFNNGYSTAAARDGLISYGITPVTKTLAVDLASSTYTGGSTTLASGTSLTGRYPHDKVEGIAVVGGTLYLANDDDFGVTSAANVLATKTVGTTTTQDFGQILSVDVSKFVTANAKPVLTAQTVILPTGMSTVSGQVSGTDAEGSTLIYSVATAPATGTGTVTVNSNGTFVFTKGASFGTGTTFKVKALDAAGNVSDAVTITVNDGAQVPYVTALSGGVIVKPIITVGMGVNNKADGSPYRMVGIPDGLGAYDNGDGTFTVVMNHELVAGEGVVRAHGAIGSFVSKWIINKSTLAVTSGADLTTQYYTWNGTAYAATSPALTRFCSGDMPAVTALKNGSKGTDARIHFNGEENSGGRAFAHIITGTYAGKSYELPRFGKAAFENLVANPKAMDTTLVMAQDDQGLRSVNGLQDQPSGAVYCYIGTKQAPTGTSTPIEDAGLTNGLLYGVAVTGYGAEDRTAPFGGLVKGSTTTFTLVALGTAGDVTALSGDGLDADGDMKGATRFLRPEDGAWDPVNPSNYYFNTTDRIDNNKNGGDGSAFPNKGRSRLWRLHFNDLSNPIAGGTIEMLIDGSEDPGCQMLDNLTVDTHGRVILNEDPGVFKAASKNWVYDTATKALAPIAKNDPTLFGDLVAGKTTSPTAPYITDEELSGVIDAKDILGDGWFLQVTQAHYLTNDTETVEGGQLMAIYIPQTKDITTTSAPTIVGPSSITLVAGATSAALAVTIDDKETPAASLILTVSSSNVNLVPAANLVLGGSGKDRTLTVTTAAGLYGNSTVTLTVTDGDGRATSTTFTVAVAPTQTSKDSSASIGELTNKSDGAKGCGAGSGMAALLVGVAFTVIGRRRKS